MFHRILFYPENWSLSKKKKKWSLSFSLVKSFSGYKHCVQLPHLSVFLITHMLRALGHFRASVSSPLPRQNNLDERP